MHAPAFGASLVPLDAASNELHLQLAHAQAGRLGKPAAGQHDDEPHSCSQECGEQADAAAAAKAAAAAEAGARRKGRSTKKRGSSKHGAAAAALSSSSSTSTSYPHASVAAAGAPASIPSDAQPFSPSFAPLVLDASIMRSRFVATSAPVPLPTFHDAPPHFTLQPCDIEKIRSKM
jgi:hypothetical protein